MSDFENRKIPASYPKKRWKLCSTSLPTHHPCKSRSVSKLLGIIQELSGEMKHIRECSNTVWLHVKTCNYLCKIHVHEKYTIYMVLSGLGLALLILWKKQITEEIKYVCRPFHQSFGPPHVVGSFFFLLGWFLREVCGRWWREQSGPIKTLYFNEYPLWIKFLTLHAPLT